MHIEWQVENNDYCRQVLRKHWPAVPCHYDITTIDWRDIPRVDLICGGFPCQPFSLAGKRRGKADDRYLWPEVVRCLAALRPTWFLGENVPGIINLALDQVCTDLESLGYEVATFNLPACAVDAPHIRKRIWIVAYTAGCAVEKCTVEYTQGLHGQPRGMGWKIFPSSYWEAHQPGMAGVAHGVPNRVDRLRGLGNAVVPQIAEELGRMILELTEGG